MSDTTTRTVPPAGAFCVDTKISRTTGAPISVLNLSAKGADVEISDDGDKWAARCEAHGWIVFLPTRRDAHHDATRPEEWCADCAQNVGIVFVAEFDVA